MITLPEALNYEIQSSKLAARTKWNWLQEVLSWWFAAKTQRKWERYNAVNQMKELLKDFKP